MSCTSPRGTASPAAPCSSSSTSERAEFLERAGPLLLADEARHNLILGVAANVRDLPHLYPAARFWVVDGAAALQTPPYNLTVARPRDATALAAIDLELPGVTAAVPEMDDFAALWGRPTELEQRLGRFCFLSTDATNATAERIYARLGYQCIAASRQLAFA